jgi:hypothetical protein
MVMTPTRPEDLSNPGGFGSAFGSSLFSGSDDIRGLDDGSVRCGYYPEPNALFRYFPRASAGSPVTSGEFTTGLANTGMK